MNPSLSSFTIFSADRTNVSTGLEPCLFLLPQEFGQHLSSHRYSNPLRSINIRTSKHYVRSFSLCSPVNTARHSEMNVPQSSAPELLFRLLHLPLDFIVFASLSTWPTSYFFFLHLCGVIAASNKIHIDSRNDRGYGPWRHRRTPFTAAMLISHVPIEMAIEWDKKITTLLRTEWSSPFTSSAYATNPFQNPDIRIDPALPGCRDEASGTFIIII